MQTHAKTVGMAGVLAVLLTLSTWAQGMIESNFDDFVFPGEAGNGWVDAWQHASTMEGEILTDDPIDGGTPYLRMDVAPGATPSTRNVARQYESGAGVDIEQVHTIRWKFRVPLSQEYFSETFTTSNDSIAFFGRGAPRLTNRQDGNTSWQMFASGSPISGVGAGQTFWIYDNVDGTGANNLNNNFDSGVPMIAGHVYAFAVTVYPDELSYTVSILDETSGASFQSRDLHRFRSSSATATSHTWLHFSTQANPNDQILYFDLDSVSIVQGIPLLPPAIENVVPIDYAVHPAGEGIRFEVLASEPIDDSAITLSVNGSDVSDELAITGEPTHRTVHYDGLESDEAYTFEITASNDAGTVIVSRSFSTASGPFVLYDSEGFDSDTLYPPGPLGEVTHGVATWFPHGSEPAEIVDAGPPQGKVLERMNMGAARADWLHFPQLASGTLTLEFDARVSTTEGRMFDVSFSPLGSAQMTHLLGWGVEEGKLSYYDGSDWIPIMDIDEEWHHYEVINYLSGPAAGRFDLLVNGEPVAEMLPWRNVEPGTPIGRFRLHSHQSGPVFEYSHIDNLVITGAPEDEDAFPPPDVINLRPFDHAVVRPQDGLSFEVTSHVPITSGDISLHLNGDNVSAHLVAEGSQAHLAVAYTGDLNAGERYLAEISATNAAGTTEIGWTFLVTEEPVTLYDSGGFEDAETYPPGPLGPVAGDGWEWIPGEQPPEVVVTEEPYNRVLRKTQRNEEGDVDYLDFPPVSTGVLTVSFDARMSWRHDRTLDVFLLRPGQTGGGHQASLLIWGHISEQLSYYDGSYRPIYDLDEEWHHYEVIHYLDRNRFDLVIDGEVVGTDLNWRNVFPEGTALGRLRLATIRGFPGDYAEVDNLAISVRPSEVPPDSVPEQLIRNLRHSGTEVTFDLVTAEGTEYVIEYSDTLLPDDWTTLATHSGNGEIEVVTDPNPNAARRFYRVRTTAGP